MDGSKSYSFTFEFFQTLARIPKAVRTKWDAKSEDYIFTGYCENNKGYRHINEKCPTEIIIARDVVFIEKRTNDQVRISENKIEGVINESENEEGICIIESPNDNRQQEEAVQTEIWVSDDNEKKSLDKNVQSISKTGDLSSEISERLSKQKQNGL
ncbi:hypothetical protein JTB14_000924 [Gonioctena quinquepunctata]|nr:hypothetical protein JTB14_000924 [Gonioctena quinquepunctata]